MSKTDEKSLAQRFDELDKKVKSEESGMFAFLRKGDNVLRLVLQEGQVEENFYEETRSYYRGKGNRKYVIWAIVKASGDNITAEENLHKVRPVIIGKGIRDDIIAHVKKEYDFWHPIEGNYVTIVREGEGINTSYNFIPSAKPLALKTVLGDAKLVWPQLEDGTVMTLPMAAEKFAKDSQARDVRKNSSTDSGEPATKEEASLGEEAKAGDW